MNPAPGNRGHNIENMEKIIDFIITYRADIATAVILLAIFCWLFN